MIEALQKLEAAGEVDLLDVAFGEWLARWGAEPLVLAGALASSQVNCGHVYLDLGAAGESLREYGIAAPERWAETLAASEAVAPPGGRAPLVLDEGRLYLHRYWHHETGIAAALKRLAEPLESVDATTLAKELRRLFPQRTAGELDRQALAALLGVTRRLAIISGGPGTGKTTSVKKLIELARALTPDLDIALAAPTGKAAGRLAEATDELAIPAQTVHRLLGYNPARQTVRRDGGNPLAADLVVVDEASMVDIGLMARLLAALKPTARVVLVGDRDQLASVEAGAVFGDICSVAAGFSPEAAESLSALLDASLPQARDQTSIVSDSIVLLKHNYRFGNTGIGGLARAIIAGNAGEALDFLPPSPPKGEGRSEGAESNVDDECRTSLHQVANAASLGRELARIVEACFRPVLDASSPEKALSRLERFRLLAAERRGPFGVEGLNAQVETLLGIRPDQPWYPGHPILVTENDRELELFNGDSGVIWPDEANRARLWINGPGDTLRSLSPARLPAHETAWALTVHKAQGSEFDRVALVLPPYESRVATRELVYTGVTRARESVELWATEATLRRAIRHGIRRASGLAARLE